MNLQDMSINELQRTKAKLELELVKLRATKKNLNNTIKNITDDMRAYRLKHKIITDNAHEAPRA